MNRITHILMILLFALLQSVAPLVHAHVDGHNFHANSVQTALQTNNQSIQFCSSAEEFESPAISLDNEIQREVNDTLADNLAPLPLLPASNIATLTVTSANSWPARIDNTYRHPPRQAPPIQD